MKNLLLAAVFFCSSTVYSQQTEVDFKKDRRLNALQWMQTSAEYRALSKQAYRLALTQLVDGLNDKNWSADEVQMKSNDFQKKKPAVILDVDETVLDNSPFNARNVLAGKSYTFEAWTDWVLEKKATAIPGSLNFITKANELGVEIFYVTNRRDNHREATIKNLKALGFPADEEHLLTRNDDKGRGGDKVTRRAMVAKNHRIILLIGDNMADVCSEMDVKDIAKRNQVAAEKEKHLGSRWIVLPNPVYGGWQRALDSSIPNLNLAR